MRVRFEWNDLVQTGSNWLELFIFFFVVALGLSKLARPIIGLQCKGRWF